MFAFITELIKKKKKFQKILEKIMKKILEKNNHFTCTAKFLDQGE